MNINFNNYLTEQNLSNYLQYIFPNSNWIHNKCFLNYKFRPDYVEYSLKIILEFDGPTHYTNPKIILNDYKKEDIIKKEGYKLIRIPFFVQLDKITINKLFNRNVINGCNYKQGFISKEKTLRLPSEFCELGVERFKKDLINFNYLKEDILKSLYDRIQENNLNILEVFPPSMIYNN